MKTGHNVCGYNKKTGRPEFVGTEKCSSQVDILLGESPAAKLWGYMWENQELDGPIIMFYEGAGVTRPTLMKVFPEFQEQEWIICSRVVRGVQYFKVNTRHYIVKEMLDLIGKFTINNVHVELAKDAVRDKQAIENKPKKKKVRRRKKKSKKKKNIYDL